MSRKTEIHLLDRRSGERFVRQLTGAYAWRGESSDDFWWREGNGSSDSNRSPLIYQQEPFKLIDCSAPVNVIVIEKITVDGTTVYQDTCMVDGTRLDDETDRARARLLALACHLSSIQGATMEVDADMELHLERARLARNQLAETGQFSQYLCRADEAIAAGARIHAADEAQELRAADDLSALDEHVDPFVSEVFDLVSTRN